MESHIPYERLLNCAHKMLREWDTIGRHQKILIRAPLDQLRDSCTYAATSRHIEYEMRKVYGDDNHALQPIHFPDINLISHRRLKQEFNMSNPVDHKLSTLLDFAENQGVTLWNNYNFKITGHQEEKYGWMGANKKIIHSKSLPMRIQHLGGWIREGTVLGTMGIFDDYGEGGSIYYGKGTSKSNHTVVITGLKAVVGYGTCFVFQDSHGEAGTEGKGRFLASMDVLQKVYRVILPFPNELRRPVN